VRWPNEQRNLPVVARPSAFLVRAFTDFEVGASVFQEPSMNSLITLMSAASATTAFLALSDALQACALESSSCTALAIQRPMLYEATLPKDINPSDTVLETCFGTTCDSARLAFSPNPQVKGLRCEDLDGRTVDFPTTCSYDDATRTVKFDTNTVYGGHAGADRLVVIARGNNGERVEILRGTVKYQDTSDDSSRGACTVAKKTRTRGLEQRRFAPSPAPCR
jgi:hypothetical protein